MLTDPARGHYSNKFQVLEQDRADRMKNVGMEHARQVSARERAKKLSVETNRRRKALETKKKLEAQRESKRRQEVLQERSQRHREATNRYQRLNKGSARRHVEHNNTAPAYPGAPLQDGVLMARGQRMDSPRTYGNGTPSLDDVLQMVGVPTSLSLKYGQGYQTYQHNGMAPASTYPTTSHYNGSYLDTNANVKAGSEIKAYAKPTHSALTSVANQGRVDSRASLLEQEIAEQQKQLIAQQQRTLQEFSRAIESETKNVTRNLERSGSLSSLDSLEEQKNSHEDLSQRQGTGQHGLPMSQGSGGTYGYNGTTQVGTKETTANYSLYHNDVLMRGSYDKIPAVDKGASPATRTAPSTTASNVSAYNGIGFNGVAYNGIVSTANASNCNVSNSGYTPASDYRTAKEDDSQERNKKTAQAWSTSKASKPPITQHASAAMASAGQRSRPYSARTTATAVTVTPAVSYAVRNHDTEARVGAFEPSPAGHGSKLPYRPSDSRIEGTPQGILSHEENDHMEEAEEKEVPPPRSILKVHKSETPSKDRKTRGLAAAIMKDSLEIGKQCGMRTPKKSVRWTDLNYIDEERVDTHVTTESATLAAARRPILVSTVDARTVQERLGGRTETAVTGTPPRPKSGSTSTAKDRSSVQIKNGRPAVNGTDTKQYQVEKEKVTDKSTPVVQNGIRLDKTPTDDEINWLWDKVRTCLHTREEGGDTSNASQVHHNRQSAANPNNQDPRITANLRVAPPANKPRFSQYNDTLRRHVIAPRYGTGSDAGSHVQQHKLDGSQPRRVHARSSSASRASGQQRGPEPSQQGPGRSQATSHHPQQQQKQVDMTDSLMVFQQAEQMVQQDADDADIVAVIEQPRPRTHQTHHEQKVHPSALSIEEAKIMESLDRLNKRLKTVTAEMNGSFSPAYPVMPPRPPPTHAGGFRGHRPMSSRPGVSGVAARPNHRARAHSADRSSVRMGHHR